MSQKINCLIVDDEPLAQQVIETYIQKMPSLVLVGKCDNAMEAYEVLHNEKIDVMFLDIQMPVITGVEFFANITKSTGGNFYYCLSRFCYGRI